MQGISLKTLLEKLEYQIICGSTSVLVDNVIYDSRKDVKNCVFICMSGAKFDGHDYIAEVANRGAAAIVVEKDITLPEKVDNLTIVRVNSTRKALSYMAAAYFDYPAKKMITIGITGTKGKTTTTYMIRSILENAGKKVGLIGTIESIIGDEVIKSNNTTPESYIVQEYFYKMVKAGCDAVVMEVSSQGLMLDRVAGIEFDYGIFTNLSPDHIGDHEHKDFEDYLYWKSTMFRQCRIGIVNADDEYADQIINGHTCKLFTYGFSETADLKVSNLHLVKEPGMLGVSYSLSGALSFDAQTDIPGKFSVYNSLAAISICYYLHISEDNIKKALKEVKVKGRVELIRISDKFTLMIDYAHNAMSLRSLLTTLKEYHPKRLVCLFGCGGNRAKSRRFEMGEVSSELADLTVVTSDNPREEEPQAIIDDILVGVKKASGKYVTIINRKEAIRYCIEHAQDGDVIVLAGKGHEDYQEICGVKHHMDERELIQEVLQELKNNNGCHFDK